MFWIITKDHITEKGEDGFGELVSSGTATTKPKITFKIYDDDGELYYTGECDHDAFLTDDDGLPGALYQALRWATHNAGATDLRLKLSDVLELIPGERMKAIYTGLARSDGWVSIYG